MIEHTCVGCLGGQGADRVVGSGRAQLLQQPGDGSGIVEAGVARRVTVQQGADRVVGSGRAQLAQ